MDQGVADDFLSALKKDAGNAVALLTVEYEKALASRGFSRTASGTLIDMTGRFEKASITSEEIAPDRDEAQFKGVLDSPSGTRPFVLRVVKEKGSGRWRVAFLHVSVPPNLRLPDESTGVDQIVRILTSAFDQVDVVALGEEHQRKADSDLRIALVRNPDFSKKVRSIVVEFASTTEQSTLDRYIRGENVSMAQLERIWKSTTQAANKVWDAPVYEDFFAAVRDVNSKLPADARIRVFGGDPGPGDNRSRETAAVSVLKEQVLQKHGKALVIYGAAHFYRTMPADYLSLMGEDIGLARMLEIDYPGRTFAVIPVGGRLDLPPGVTGAIDPEYQKFDRALKTHVRPVLVSLQRSPFRDFTAEEFLVTLLTFRGASVFKGSTLTLGQMADACVYFGRDAGLDTKAKPAR